MTSQKKLPAVLIAMAVLVLLSASLRTYYVRNESWGWLFWNGKKAYVFIGMDARGYRLSYLGLAVEAVREIFPFGASAPRDSHLSVLVLDVTPDSVQRYSADNFWLSSVEPSGGVLYTGNSLGKGELLKWSSDHFEPATAEEIARGQSASRHGEIPPGPSYDNVEGWSKRTVAGDVIRNSPTDYAERDSKVTIELDGKPLTFVMNSGFISHYAYIELVRPEKTPERI
jgi:hypothetical protein